MGLVDGGRRSACGGGIVTRLHNTYSAIATTAERENLMTPDREDRLIGAADKIALMLERIAINLEKLNERMAKMEYTVGRMAKH